MTDQLQIDFDKISKSSGISEMRFFPLNIASQPSESNTSERPGRPNEIPETTGGSEDIFSVVLKMVFEIAI